MRGRRPATGMLSLTLVATVMLVAPGATAAQQEQDEAGGGATAQVRFVHAVPGVGEARARMAGTAIGSAAFGEATGTAAVPAGRSKLVLALPRGALLAAEQRLEPGAAYTAVALYAETEGGAELRFYRDGRGAPGEARIRTIQAAPELGMPDMTIGGDPLGERVEYGQATDYATVAPGSYDWAATAPGGRTVAEAADIPLTAGTSSTAVLVGTRGETVDVVLVEDATAAPSAAPATGLVRPTGGGVPRWLLVALAAIAAGSLAWLIYARTT